MNLLVGEKSINHSISHLHHHFSISNAIAEIFLRPMCVIVKNKIARWWKLKALSPSLCGLFRDHKTKFYATII